tara:strand:+ start:1613 stop:2338 length:726 start_codon:yes stop_codon:yes gene_type:complete
MSSIGLIGFGRFGKIWFEMLCDDFNIKVYDPTQQTSGNNVDFADITTVAQQNTVFVAVPIRDFKDVILEISPLISKNTTVIDVCSVKVYPVTVMTEALPDSAGIIATHPLFGPDSISSGDNLRIMMNETRDSMGQFENWKNYFESKSINVIEMSPEEHDRAAAKTQGVTHFIGRVLRDVGVVQNEVETLGFRDLLEVIDQTCNDSWDLFTDLENYNPYTFEMIKQLESSIDKIRSKILRRE